MAELPNKAKMFIVAVMLMATAVTVFAIGTYLTGSRSRKPAAMQYTVPEQVELLGILGSVVSLWCDSQVHAGRRAEC